MTNPAAADRNRTPSSTALLSAAEANAGVVLVGHRVQGQPLVVAAVVNDHVTGGVIVLPEASVAALTVAV